MASHDDTLLSFPSYAELSETVGWAGAGTPLGLSAVNAAIASGGRYRETELLGSGGMGNDEHVAMLAEMMKEPPRTILMPTPRRSAHGALFARFGAARETDLAVIRLRIAFSALMTGRTMAATSAARASAPSWSGAVPNTDCMNGT